MHRLVIALVTLLGLSGAAVVTAYLLLFDATTDRAAALAPADTVAYVNVYLQPSTGQQMNLAGLIGRLPGFADEASLDEKVDQVVQNLLASSGVDYREQVKPWLGNQVALAAWPGPNSGDEPRLVLIAEVRDRQAAQDALPGIVAADGSITTETHAGTEIRVADGAAYAFLGEMLVAGPDAGAIRAVIDVEAGAASLADLPEFRATVAELEPDHLASAYLDLAGIAAAAGASEALVGTSTAGAVLVAETDGLRLSGSAPFDVERADPSARAGFALGGEPSSLVDWMPADTIAEAVVFGLRQSLEDAETAAGSLPEGEELGNMLGTIRALAAFGLGIDLDADVLPLLDREVGVALTGFADGMPSGLVLLRPDDPDHAADALDRLASALVNAGAQERTETVADTEVTILGLEGTGEAAYALVDGIVILGLTPADVGGAIEAHGSGASLGTSATYTRTFEVAGTRAGNELYIDVAPLVALLDAEATLPADARDILLRLGTFGFTAPSRDDRVEFHAVLTIDQGTD